MIFKGHIQVGAFFWQFFYSGLFFPDISFYYSVRCDGFQFYCDFMCIYFIITLTITIIIIIIIGSRYSPTRGSKNDIIMMMIKII